MNAYVETQLETLPQGLERQTLQILSRCQGRAHSIDRDRLLDLVHSMPGLSTVEDRQIRKAIENLREAGNLICFDSAGGYYMAASGEEYREFRAKYGAYAFSILEKLKAMDKAAGERWGAMSQQGRLF